MRTNHCLCVKLLFMRKNQSAHLHPRTRRPYQNIFPIPKMEDGRTLVKSLQLQCGSVQEAVDINLVADVLWFIFVHLASVQYISYVSLYSFMSIEQSVKEFTFIYYFLFSHNSSDRCTSTPFFRLLFQQPNAPDAPKCSPSTTIVCISASLQLKEESDIHRQDRGGMIDK